jgi:hypothetical protein
MNVTFTEKTRISISTICLAAFLGVAAQAQNTDNWFVRTMTVEDLYVRVFSPHDIDTNNTSVDNKLAFCVWETKTNKNDEVTVYMPTSVEYLYQLELLDTNGIAQPKKMLAKNVGVKFLDFKPLFANDTGFELTKVHITPSLGGPYLFFPHRSGHYNGNNSYSPDDLFEIKQPGNYSLRIRFQFIVATNSNTYKSAHIVRFPPLDYPLIFFNSRTNFSHK